MRKKRFNKQDKLTSHKVTSKTLSMGTARSGGDLLTMSKLINTDTGSSF